MPIPSSSFTNPKSSSSHYPPPPPTPRIRRPRRRPPAGKPTSGEPPRRDWKPKLETLLDGEVDYSYDESVRSRESDGEEKWRVEAEMLRAECNGRIKICEGKDVDAVLKEEIQELTEKLEKLQRRSCAKDSQIRNNSNFDTQVSVHRRRWLDKNGGSSDEVEILRRKMEGLSKGILLQKMEEEYNSTSKRLEFQDLSSVIRAPHQEKVGGEGNMCYGQCKAVVQRIVEEVRAETEQWSLMQEMLGQVREEMEELQASRDFWEDRAINSDYKIQTLHDAVQEWKQRALSSETKANDLEAKLSVLRRDLETFKKEKNNNVQPAKCSPVPSEAQIELEKRILVCYSKENDNHTNADNKYETNEVSITERRRGTHGVGPKRHPFQDIRNSSSLLMRFHPTEQEVMEYLIKKVMNQPYTLPIPEVEVYQHNPEQLTKDYSSMNPGEEEWYFFSQREKLYPKRGVTKRTAPGGYWNTSGTETSVLFGGRTIGHWRTMVFYEGKRQDKPKKPTHWLMREYSLVGSESDDQTCHHRDINMKMDDDWVLCKIYKNGRNYRSRGSSTHHQQNNSDYDQKNSSQMFHGSEWMKKVLAFSELMRSD
ncbi:myosin-10 isoform X3 [Senna tora]|uniref:Myosin-10 isoform X3 n=1 Tax=Senna tora TaxID=362788 RepID=A0A834WVX1_9FABA|nr:myosin-10 isoform X3 [Senna tora]